MFIEVFFHLSRQHGAELTIFVVFLSFVFCLFFVSLASPKIIQLMLPMKRVEDEEYIRIMSSCFHRAGLKVPDFWFIDLDKFGSFNALVSGLSWGKGPFRQICCMSRGLLNKLSPDEFEALPLHEVSHIQLGHIVKRF